MKRLTDFHIGKGEKNVAVVTSIGSHFDHVVRVMRPMNANCKFIHVSDLNTLRGRRFDVAILYCNSMWHKSLWESIEEMHSRFKAHRTEVKIIEEINQPFTLIFHTF